MLFGNKNKKHLKKHAVPAAREKYLSLGGIVMHMNEPTEWVLKAIRPCQDYVQILADFWGIYDMGYCRERIDTLLLPKSEGADLTYKDEFSAYQEKKFTGAFKTNFEIFSQMATETIGLEERTVNQCFTLNGWDLERAAFLVRAGFNAGLLSEEDVWNYLSLHIAPRAKESFSSWDEYAVSYLLGRLFWSASGAQADACESIAALYGGIWKTYPIHKL